MKDWLKYLLSPALWAAIAFVVFVFWLVRLIKSFSNSSPSFNKADGGSESLKLAYENLANELDRAMNRPGTDEDIMFKLLSPLSVNDLIGVYNAFGKRTNTQGLPKFPLARAFEGNLIEWFHIELGDEDLERMKKIWRDTGLWI